MNTQRKRFGFWLAVLSAAIALSAGSRCSEARAQALPPKQARALSNDSVRLQEAQYLVQAYTAVIMANHDYAGHRGKAAHAIHEAVRILHEGVMRSGSESQQAVVMQQRASIASAEQASRSLAMVRERQAASDAQLAQAQQLLLQLRPTLVSNNQQRIVAHVDRALREIQISLQVR